MAESPTTPTTPLLLNLDTLVSRSTVRIDGIEYELLSPDEVSILDFKRLVRPGARMVEIEALPEPTAEEKAEYDRILDRQCRQVLLAPDEVHQRLKGAQRDQILPNGERLLRLLAVARGYDEPEQWSFDFGPLQQLNQLQRADVERILLDGFFPAVSSQDLPQRVG